MPTTQAPSDDLTPSRSAWPLTALPRARRVLPDLLIFGGLATLFFILGIRHAQSSSATFDEVAHLPAGFTYLAERDYRLSPSHPPLVKEWAALPWRGAEVWPVSWDTSDARRASTRLAANRLAEAWQSAPREFSAEFTFGRSLLFGLTDSARTRQFTAWSTTQRPVVFTRADFVNDGPYLLFLGRRQILVLGVVLLALIYAWARALGGRAGATVATGLAALDPNLIAHGSLVTTDMGVTVFLFAAVYCAWQIMRYGRVHQMVPLALFVGLASATKFSAALLLPILASLGVLWMLRPSRAPDASPPRARRLGILLGATLLSLIGTYGTIWAAYGFRFRAVHTAEMSWTEADTHRQMEELLRRATALRTVAERHDGEDLPIGEYQAALRAGAISRTGRFLLWAHTHQVFPEAMLVGLAVMQPVAVVRLSYFRERFTIRGSPGFFPTSLLLKTPEVTLGAILLALIVLIARRSTLQMLDVACLLLPPAWILGTAILSPVNLGFRHLLPTVPFLITLTASLGPPWAAMRRSARMSTAILGLIGGVLSLQFVSTSDGTRPIAPHFLAYFNRLAGGPDEAHRIFVDSNLDWGQALPALRERVAHEAGGQDPILLCYFGTADPRAYGLRSIALPGCGTDDGPAYASWYRPRPDAAITVPGLRDGTLVAVSATSLVGLYLAPDQHAALTEFLQHRTTAIGTAGYAIHLFRVTSATP